MQPNIQDRHRYRGSPLRERRFPGAVLTLWSAWVDDDGVEPHGHAEAHLMAVLGGAYRSAAKGADDRDQDLLIYNPAETFHHDSFKHGAGAFLSLTLEKDEEALADAPDEPTEVSTPLTRPILRGMRRAMMAADELELEVLLARMKAALCKPTDRLERRVPDWLGQVQAYLAEVSAPSLAQASREVDLHPVYVTRCFRHHLGYTPSEYAQQRRLERAMQALGERRSLAEAAEAAGFADQPHLNRACRHALGVTPRQYRQSLLVQQKV